MENLKILFRWASLPSECTCLSITHYWHLSNFGIISSRFIITMTLPICFVCLFSLNCISGTVSWQFQLSFCTKYLAFVYYWIINYLFWFLICLLISALIFHLTSLPKYLHSIKYLYTIMNCWLKKKKNRWLLGLQMIYFVYRF